MLVANFLHSDFNILVYSFFGYALINTTSQFLHISIGGVTIALEVVFHDTAVPHRRKKESRHSTWGG